MGAAGGRTGGRRGGGATGAGAGGGGAGGERIRAPGPDLATGVRGGGGMGSGSGTTLLITLEEKQRGRKGYIPYQLIYLHELIVLLFVKYN